MTMPEVMTVGKLIEQLSKLDPEYEVWTRADWTDFACYEIEIDEKNKVVTL